MTRNSLKVTICVLIMSGLMFAQKGLPSSFSKYGVGFQATFPAYGLSGMYHLNDEASVQGMFGIFGDLKTYSGRYLYRFSHDKAWNMYGYGSVGFFTYTSLVLDGFVLKEKTETVPGFGAGAGVEYSWQAFNPNLPPLWSNLELGFGSVNFNEVNFNFSTFSLGAGIHYYF